MRNVTLPEFAYSIQKSKHVYCKFINETSISFSFFFYLSSYLQHFSLHFPLKLRWFHFQPIPIPKSTLFWYVSLFALICFVLSMNTVTQHLDGVYLYDFVATTFQLTFNSSAEQRFCGIITWYKENRIARFVICCFRNCCYVIVYICVLPNVHVVATTNEFDLITSFYLFLSSLFGCHPHVVNKLPNGNISEFSPSTYTHTHTPVWVKQRKSDYWIFPLKINTGLQHIYTVFFLYIGYKAHT